VPTAIKTDAVLAAAMHELSALVRSGPRRGFLRIDYRADRSVLIKVSRARSQPIPTAPGPNCSQSSSGQVFELKPGSSLRGTAMNPDEKLD